MKKNLLQTFVAIALFSAGTLQAQWINSLTVVPANPSTLDTIYVYADCSFPSGNCDDYSAIQSQQGDTIFAYALHCLGPLTFICSYTDTFKIDPLPAGNYNFIFHVDAGAGPSPCTPGIVPGPTDSITFVVNPVTSVPLINGNGNFTIYPNPSSGKFELNMSDVFDNTKLVIYSLEGKQIAEQKLVPGKNNFDFSFLENGIYFCRIAGNNKMSNTKKIIIARVEE